MADREFKILITGDAGALQSSSKEGAASLQEMGAKGQEAHKAVAEEAEKSLVKHEDLHAIVKGLKAEFPELAHIAHFALNPLTLAVVGITSAFALWKNRLKELTDLYGNAELPDVSPEKIGHVNAAAQAWKDYADAISKAAEAYNSVDQAADRNSKKLADDGQRQRNLLEASKGLELSKLEATKGSLPAGAYETRRLEIEERYARAGLKLDESLRKKSIQARAERSEKLIRDAEQKAGAASGIRIASTEDDSATEAELKTAAEAAQKDLDDHQAKLDKLNAYQAGEGSTFQRAAYSLKYLADYGYGLSPDDVRRLERQSIDSARQPIARYREFVRGRAARDELRKRRSTLIDSSSKEVVEARQIQDSLPDDIAGFNVDSAANHQVAGMQSLSRAYNSAGNVAQDAKALLDQVHSAIEAGHGVQVETLRKLREFTDSQKDILQRINSLESPSRRVNHL